MQKKLIAAAVAGMLAVPAYAQLGTGVVLYGRVNVGFDNYEAEGAAAGSAFDSKGRNRVYDSASRIGIRGTEDLGRGLKAIFQVESGFAADTGAALTQNGAAASDRAVLGSREAWAGLQSNWGSFRFGKQNVWWTTGRVNQVQANWLAVGSPLATGGLSYVGAPTVRTLNTFHYQTPNFAGFNASIYYSPQPVGTTINSGQELAGPGVEPEENLWAATLRYNAGPFTAQFDWAKRNEVNNNVTAAGVATGLDTDNYGYKLGLAYTYVPGAQVGFIWNRVGTDNVLGTATGGGVIFAAGDDIKMDSWTLEWEHTFGNILAIAEYGQSRDLKGSSLNAADTASKYWNVGVRYNFSRRTALYAQYAQVRNEANAMVDFRGGGMSGAAGGAGPGISFAQRGADPRIINVGIQHNF